MIRYKHINTTVGGMCVNEPKLLQYIGRHFTQKYLYLLTYIFYAVRQPGVTFNNSLQPRSHTDENGYRNCFQPVVRYFHYTAAGNSLAIFYPLPRYIQVEVYYVFIQLEYSTGT